METNLTHDFKGVSTAKVGTLKPALNVIPKHCYERPTYKGALVVAQAVVLWAASVAILIAFNNPLIVIFGWIFSSLALAGMFVVGHDAAHGSLFNSKKANKIVGRLLFLPELHSYEGWLLGHNRLHHGHTVREQMDFVWHPTTREQYENMSAWRKLQHKVEWGFLGAGAYYLRNVWFDKMVYFTPPERYRDRIKKDVRFVAFFAAISVAILFAIGFAQFDSIFGGSWMVLKVLVVPWLGFMTIIGWTVYVHHIAPDIKWWPRNDWNSFKGQIEGTTVLYCPTVLNKLFFYNIFVHVPHHVDMRIPCYNLPQAANALVKEFPEITSKKLRFRDYIKTVRACKLYDFNEHRWYTYSSK